MPSETLVLAAEYREYKRKAKRAAADLCYGDEVIKKINNAKSADEISRIMANARREKQ